LSSGINEIGNYLRAAFSQGNIEITRASKFFLFFRGTSACMNPTLWIVMVMVLAGSLQPILDYVHEHLNGKCSECRENDVHKLTFLSIEGLTQVNHPSYFSSFLQTTSIASFTLPPLGST